ncbi:MAG: AbrB/MazE/SpoVT family DNA-binding domain-containing protein [Clostridiales bacterium]|nr:AbrB/MazE/SpoVT family DNA-binding domain-containing protein [Clostridiales bacterium]
MVETGMVRRVDELGRVVIPKEIRKTLRIKEGEPLEIFTEKEQLVLKKYSPIESVLSYAECVCASLNEMTDKIVYVFDTDKLVCASIKNKNIIGEPVAFETEKVMRERKSSLRTKTDGSQVPPAFKGEETEGVYSRITFPIVSGGDVFGAIVLTDKKGQEEFTKQEEQLVSLCALMLSKRFE